MTTKNSVLADLELQHRIAKWENTITDNLRNLSQALQLAISAGFMSREHGKNIWKSYLHVSGIDIPKDLKDRVSKALREAD